LRKRRLGGRGRGKPVGSSKEKVRTCPSLGISLTQQGKEIDIGGKGEVLGTCGEDVEFPREIRFFRQRGPLACPQMKEVKLEEDR